MSNETLCSLIPIMRHQHKIASVVLLILWGGMGFMVGCCLLGLLIGLVPGTIHSAIQPIEFAMKALVGYWDARLEGFLLLGLFGFGGFIVASVLRLIGLRKQYGGL
jgi:hypothetical protein